MAVSGPSDGNGFESEDAGLFVDINITPLTDIFLVLLIIFMVAAPAILEAGQNASGLKVTLPKGGRRDAAQEIHDLSVAILGDGRIVMGGKVVDEGALKEIFATAHRLNPETLLLLQADEGVPHGRVVAVMELARGEGLTRLAIATRAADNGQ